MVSIRNMLHGKNADGREDVKMLKVEVMKYLLDETIVRVEQINKFNKIRQPVLSLYL